MSELGVGEAERLPAPPRKGRDGVLINQFNLKASDTSPVQELDPKARVCPARAFFLADPKSLRDTPGERG